VNIDAYTGLPELPENHFWELYAWQYDTFYADGVEWRIAIYKRRRFWFRKSLGSVSLVPEYKKTWQTDYDTFSAYLIARAKEAYDKAFKLTPEHESCRQWLGEYPPKSVINDGVTVQDLANDEGHETKEEWL
jgi:hypothetical protein